MSIRIRVARVFCVAVTAGAASASMPASAGDRDFQERGQVATEIPGSPRDDAGTGFVLERLSKDELDLWRSIEEGFESLSDVERYAEVLAHELAHAEYFLESPERLAQLVASDRATEEFLASGERIIERLDPELRQRLRDSRALQVARRGQRAAQLGGGLLLAVGVDETRLAHLRRGAGELAQQECSMPAALAGDVLLGDQVHAVASS